MEIKKVDTNTPGEQVDTNNSEIENNNADDQSSLTNANEIVSQEDNWETRYDKTFDEIDLDNPDMSLFADKTNVEDETEQTIETDKTELEEDNSSDEFVSDSTTQEEISSDDNTSNPFAVDEEGYLIQKLVDRGKEMRVTPEELFEFGNKGINYEARNAEMKPFKEYINVLKKNKNISIEDLTSLADLSNGNKDALKHLISKYEVDVYDVDASEEQYTPNTSEYNSDPVAEIWSDFQQQNPKDSEVVANVFNSVDEDFRKELYTEKTFPLFVDDVKRGIFDKMLPETQKIKALYPEVTWIQAYSEANRRLTQAKPKKEVPPAVSAPRDNNPSVTLNAQAKADKIWDDPDAFNEMMRNQLTI